MAEPINAAYLPFVEIFGTRNQELVLSEVINPTWDLKSDAMAAGRLVGADATGPLTGAGSGGQVACQVSEANYCTTIFLVEPTTTVKDTVTVNSAFVLRNYGGTFTQLAALRCDPFAANRIGNGGTGVRTYPLTGWPWGALLLAGDLLVVNYLNEGAAAFTAGAILGFRGLAGPPA